MGAPVHMGDQAPSTAGRRASDGLFGLVFDQLPRALAVFDSDGTMVACNWALQRYARLSRRRALGSETCCSLFGCGDPGSPLAGACLTRMTLAGPDGVSDLQLHLASGPVHASASRLDDWCDRVVVEVTPDRSAARQSGELHITTLGRTRIEGADGERGAPWLDQRPGQLLKLLVAERGRVLTVEFIAEGIWAEATFAMEGTVRHLVHVLRKCLEDGRPAGKPSRYVLSRGGGYTLSDEHVVVDADEFLVLAAAGLDAFARRGPLARQHLDRALVRYGGDFLADEPYAAWALAEREHLRDQAAHVLRALSDLAVEAGELPVAMAYAERLSAMEPFDSDIHRHLIGLTLQAGRRTRALRLYQAYQLRLHRAFGERPDFDLAELRPAPLRLAQLDAPSWPLGRLRSGHPHAT
jgi:DNA-binding SARP family transcriptional activator